MPDSQTLILLVAAMVAGVVIFRLYTVLGRRTGQEPEPGNPAARPVPQPVLDAPPAPDERGEPELRLGPSQGGLVDIQLADKNFDPARFLSGAREAYGLIVNAFAKGDREALRPLLSPDVFAAFDAGIAARGDAEPAFLSRLVDARISHAAMEVRQAEVTVAFSAEFTSGPVTDVWTFARDVDSDDPNWLLVGTSGDDLPGPEPE